MVYKNASYLAPGWTAAEVIVALLLAYPRHFPLEPHRAVQSSPPESYRRVWKRLEFLCLATENVNRPNRGEKRNGVNQQYQGI